MRTPNLKEYTYQGVINLARNDFETEDSFFDFGQNSHEGTFFQIDKFYSHEIIKEAKPNQIYIMTVYLSEKGLAHKRVVYNLLDVMGDIGGVFEITMIVFGFMFFPIS